MSPGPGGCHCFRSNCASSRHLENLGGAAAVCGPKYSNVLVGRGTTPPQFQCKRIPSERSRYRRCTLGALAERIGPHTR